MSYDFDKELTQLGDDSWDSLSESFLSDDVGIKENIDPETQKILNTF